MDFNTTILRFGFDTSNFVNKPLGCFQTEEGMIYEAEEAYKERICPFCNHSKLFVHDYSWMKIKLNTTIGVKEIFRVKRIRYRCPKCKKTHTFPLQGIERNKTISNFTLNAIKKEFFEIQSFATIAKRYSISVNQVVNIFDEYVKVVPRRPLPEYLCIDEKAFEGDTDGKYCVILSDFFSGEVIDIISNRQMPYLEEYFSSIPPGERNTVKVFISDMYDAYSTIKNKYFPKAIFVVDLFHVVKLLTTAVNKLRIRTYNQYTEKDSLERHFMKTNWKMFLANQNEVFKNEYHSKKFNLYISYGDIILRCLQLNTNFWDGYNALQELIKYDKYDSFEEASKFINRIIHKLALTQDDLLVSVSDSYSKWKVGIANGLAKNQTGRRFTNAIAENNNSHIQRIINVAYGYQNFKRFRARVMLIMTYKKK